MLAISLLATGILAAMELFQRAQAGTTDSEHVLIATHLATARLEELHNTAYASLANEAKAAIASPAGYSRFSRQVTVTTPYANLKQVVVTVYWTLAGGETSVSVQTYRSGV